MSSRPRPSAWKPVALATGLALCLAPLAPTTALAAPDGSGVVIAEAYLKGGSANAPFSSKFVELYNPTDAAVSLATWSLQYRSATGAGTFSAAPLSGSIAPGGHFLVRVPGNGGATPVGAALPTPDAEVTLNPSGTTGTLVLSDGTAPLTLPQGSIAAGTPGVVDLLGYGTSATFETAAAPVVGVNNVPNSLVRTDGADTDVNAADFTTATTVTPQNAAGTTPVDPGPAPLPTPVGSFAIDDIQGDGATSPYVDQAVTTQGVVTARYEAAGDRTGYVVQTAGTGAALDGRSDALYVASAATVADVAIGDAVELTGLVSEQYGVTQLVVTDASQVVALPAADVVAPVPAAVAFPADDAGREALENMLLLPQGGFTVSEVYDTGTYGEIVLATGDSPLVQPTEVARPGSPEYAAVVADNAARRVVLDDGSSTNYTTGDSGTAVAWLSPERPLVVGAAATFAEPVIVDFGFSEWRFQPTERVTGATPLAELPVQFSDARAAAAPAEVGGDVTLASFNVLNYFTTTGDELTGCRYYGDRVGDPITVRDGCDARGAAEQEDLDRQQAKIVAAIDALGSDVVSLEEIENSAKFGQDRDAALATLVDALNERAGTDEWAFVPSPAVQPPLGEQDVIRLAFVYKPAAVEPVGGSEILVGSTAFGNARQPLAQEFRAVGGDADAEFVAIANHLKSKGSGSGADADQGDGQGGSNASRVAQAQALVTFADERSAAAGTDKVFLLGDFNSYSQEDPIEVLRDAGYATLGSTQGDEYSYVFDGLVGSLDHVLASPAAAGTVTGVDVWNINSVESIALEYSRYNTNATLLYAADPYRASDHDPILVGLDLLADDEAPVDPAPGDPAPPVVDPGQGGALPGGPGAEPTPGATPGATAPTASGPLAFTGADLAGWLTLALVLLGTGGTVLVVRRRASA